MIPTNKVELEVILFYAYINTLVPHWTWKEHGFGKSISSEHFLRSFAGLLGSYCDYIGSCIWILTSSKMWLTPQIYQIRFHLIDKHSKKLDYMSLRNPKSWMSCGIYQITDIARVMPSLQMTEKASALLTHSAYSKCFLKDSRITIKPLLFIQTSQN